MIYLLSEKRLKADFLNDNIDSSLILSAIATSQDIFLRQTLGDSLLDKICNLVRDNELEEPYKTLLDEYIIIYLEYLAMAELCVPSTFKLGNIGIAQAYDSNINTQTIQNVKYLESYYKTKSAFYENRLTTFIQKHCNLYPEYNTVSDVTVSSESTLQCGIYLGGTSKKRTIINNSNNTNTEVGNYVRYDKAQNLSELEKAQARENIGVSASGDIVVDLENYYTKSEVFNKTEIDTKLIPYITDNEVNLRLQNYSTKSQTETAIQNAIDNIEIPDVDLSNYYDKNTVNNLLDNLPIPEYTSELVKDDVYTKSEVYNKSEVNELIDNVTSGDIDLTNYYTKEEVDNLVANSGGGSSDVDLDNYYTKSEVDNLIENVDVDLSDYYTKEQVYNKQETYSVSQIDTLISQVPTFSGSYSDLTDTPTFSAVATSGSYNDLTNKPTLFDGNYNSLSNKPTIPTDTAQLTKSDIYTKAETFTRDEIVNMINEINYSDINNTPTLSTVATSGSYNDLTDKPQIYTTEQVYTKSEIDTQISDLSNQIGNINNLLETI